MLYELDGVAPHKLDADVWIADTASVIGCVELHKHSSVWFGCVVRGDTDPIIIGEGSNIQDLTMIHADVGFPTTIGKNVTVGHNVILHGCSIDDNSLIGMGATVLNGARIGKNCIVGANALITEGKAFPDGSMIMGSPAKVVRSVTNEEVQLISYSAELYQNNSRHFSKSLKLIE